jgi:hypothetical protein
MSTDYRATARNLATAVRQIANKLERIADARSETAAKVAYAELDAKIAEVAPRIMPDCAAIESGLGLKNPEVN